MHGIRPAGVPPIPCLATEGSQIIFLFFHVTTAVGNSWPQCCVFTGNGNYAAALHTAVAFKHDITLTLTFNHLIRGYVFFVYVIMIVFHSSFAVINSHLLSPYSHILSFISPHLHVFVCGDVSQ